MQSPYLQPFSIVCIYSRYNLEQPYLLSLIVNVLFIILKQVYQ